jgi:Recombinase zinc beta ribbon domain
MPPIPRQRIEKVGPISFFNQDSRLPRAHRGQAFGRPTNGVESKYLLTGFGVCAGCGGSMATLKRAHGPRGHRRQVPFYGCMTRHLRGDAICANALEVRLDDADQAVLAAVERDVLNIAVLETSLHKAVAALQASAASNGAEAHAAAWRDELAGLDAEVGRLAEAIARGGDLPALVALLEERERRRARVRAALAAAGRTQATRGDVGDLRHTLDVMRAALTDWQGMLRQEPPEARRALRALLAGRLVFTPTAGFYSFEGPGTITPVLTGVVGACAKGMVAPTGFEPAFPCPLRCPLQNQLVGTRHPSGHRTAWKFGPRFQTAP